MQPVSDYDRRCCIFRPSPLLEAGEPDHRMSACFTVSNLFSFPFGNLEIAPGRSTPAQEELILNKMSAMIARRIQNPF